MEKDKDHEEAFEPSDVVEADTFQEAVEAMEDGLLADAIGMSADSSKLPTKPEPDPEVLVVFPLTRSVAFPGLMIPVLAQAGKEQEILAKARAQGKRIGLILAHGEGSEAARGSDMHEVGTLAEIHQRIKLPDGTINYLCRGKRRFRVKRWVKEGKVPVARVEYLADIYPQGDEVAALSRNVLSLAQEVAGHNPSLGPGFQVAVMNIEAGGNLADFVAAYLLRDAKPKQEVLEQVDVRARLQMVDELLTKETTVLELGERIQEEIREKVEKAQKEFFLREQIKIIRRELGEEVEPQERDRELFQERLDEGTYPDEVADKIRSEMERLETIPSISPEYPVVRNYLEWLTELPWSVSSEDRYDIAKAERILDRDHYGLQEAKERILEFLGVRKMRPQSHGPILCFSGPPGVGKTSLGRAIAQATGRKFERMSLGGMRDEAEIKGHRRTYVGALPGRVLQMIRHAGTNNPVIVLDEIDKIGKDFRGDPASALLEVLDPEQNGGFLDFYMDLTFDLSKVLFIATANVLHTIPNALRDRMEVIELPGYVTAEKVQIARRHLLPRQLEAHGLEPSKLKLPTTALRSLVNGWTREAGVRQMEKGLARVCRKRALELARRKRPRAELKAAGLEKYLGPPKFLDERLRLRPEKGVALGLAWTGYGGDVLEIEAAAWPGKGRVVYTGSLGDVMTESCRIAHSFLRAECACLGFNLEAIDTTDLHVHFPAGAVPKDGPSAGITIACAMLSRLTGRRLRARLAMTGELTLTGEVLPVGGIREKVLVAKRRGIKRVVLPFENERDVRELDEGWTRGLEFLYVRRFDEVLAAAF